jgi:hypothetical protein
VLACTIVVLPEWPVAQLIVTAILLLFNFTVYLIRGKQGIVAMISQLSLPLIFVAIVFDRQGYSSIVFISFMVISHSVFLIVKDSR